MLDVGCGTGAVARRIAPLVGPLGRVVGLDISPAMLAVACQAAERDGVTIEWQVGRSESLPFPDGGFDLVVSQQGLQFAVDKPAAVAEMRRALAPGGRVAVCLAGTRSPSDLRRGARCGAARAPCTGDADAVLVRRN